MGKIKVMLVFGTRPEAIKMAPLVNELKHREEIEVIVCVSAQHREMLDQVLHTFQIVPDYDLDIMKSKQSLNDITSKVLLGMSDVLEKEQPDIVLVHGDTTTTFASALAAFHFKTCIGHVEAGLRTYDKYSPYPEEMNRQMVSCLADYHFAPTQESADNLIREGHTEGIYITGNTVIDSMYTTIQDSYRNENLTWASDSRMILLTTHRRENIGLPMQSIFNAIIRVVDTIDDVKVIFPMHKNPEVRKLAYETLGKHDRIRLIEPLEVIDFHNFQKQSYLILSDSGGIQEEAPSLGKPVLVLRDTTERPEGIAAGTLKLVGTNEDTIYCETIKLLTDVMEYDRMSKAMNPYGDGNASKRIADIIVDEFKEKVKK